MRKLWLQGEGVARLFRERLGHACGEASRGVLATRLPGGAAWCAREVPMWKRSQVEQLTGLTRHMIQDLCNPNTSGDGLGFWEPAVSKPGYSRFDEGDLLAFYLVRQLMKAGFTLKEVERAVFSLLEEGDAFVDTLRNKERQLLTRLADLSEKLATLEYLEDAAARTVDDRLRSVMEVALAHSVERAVASARAHGAPSEAMVHRVRARLDELTRRMLDVIWDELSVEAPLFDVPESPRFVDVREAAARARALDKAESQALVNRMIGQATRLLVCSDGTDATADECPGSAGAAAGSADADAPDETSLRFARAALCHVLTEAENGVPIELALGEGSFSLLGMAAMGAFENGINDKSEGMKIDG